MTKTVSFSTEVASGISKNKKRLRGNPNKSPEVKKYNPTSDSLWQGLSFYNCCYGSLAPLSLMYAYFPYPLGYPSVGTGSGQRIGSDIFLKFYRFKGYFQLMNRMVQPVRWRMVLCRVDLNVDANPSTVYNTSWYLSHFNNIDNTVISATTGNDQVESWARHNFYKKIRDVNDTNFKRKVIASGFFPAVCNHKNYEGQFVGTMGDAPISGTFELNGYNASAHGGFAGYVPLDVSVKINDRINCSKNLRRYFVLFEYDTCMGYDADLTPMYNGINYSTIRGSLSCLAYFTDS